MRYSQLAKWIGMSSAAAMVSALMSSNALAITGDDDSGDCSVSQETPYRSSTTFFVPSGGDGSYAMLGWGTVLVVMSGSYDGMLKAAAEQCVVVAAAETSSSGDGTDVVCIFSTGDTLVPALPLNAGNCQRNSPFGRCTQRTTSGTHFSPYSGSGGAAGRAIRDFTGSWL